METAKAARVKPFLSTPSARRATRHCNNRESEQRISIHALREEGDAGYFSGKGYITQFLSTPSARRAT